MLTFALMSAETGSLLCDVAAEAAPGDMFMALHAALVDRFEFRLKQVNPQFASLQYDVSDLVSCCNAMLSIAVAAFVR